MNSETTVEKAADKARTATDKVADKAERTVESARHYANEALDKADARVRSLREENVSFPLPRELRQPIVQLAPGH